MLNEYKSIPSTMYRLAFEMSHPVLSLTEKYNPALVKISPDLIACGVLDIFPIRTPLVAVTSMDINHPSDKSDLNNYSTT